ncbi:MAG: two-component system, response regulator YesN [Clostridiales bacterium]|nr:two-component system, response regulator YesN [Clostridiales bacterium]
MYKVLLVDDEPEVMLAVIKKMDWENLGFEVVGYAQNGEEALEMAELEVPDVVMTDIKMPFMDGLTLSKKLKETYAGIKIIIFSGFDEFEYAREAIKIEVEEYILKPMKLDELSEIFKRIGALLDKERNEKLNIDKLKEYYLNSLPILQDQFFIALIEGRMPDSYLSSYMENYQITMNGSQHLVAVYRMSTKKDRMLENDMEMKVELQKISIKHFLDDGLKEFSFHSFVYFDQIIHITSFHDGEDIKYYVDQVNKICKLVKRVLDVQVVAGIGKSIQQISHLKFSYEGAKNAAFYRGSDGISHATYIEELEPSLNEMVSLDDQNIQAIITEIKMGDKEKLTQQVEHFINAIKLRKLTIEQLQIILMGIITELYKLTCAYNMEALDLFGDNLDLYKQLLHFNGVEEVQEWLMQICLSVRKAICKERKNTAKVIIDKAVQYIVDNFGDSSLSIEKICNELNVSSAYFSTIFKRETGKTFLNYLTDIRMEQAILLLDGTEEKTYIISEKVGYSEPNYFSYVFKKKYGMAPSRYRRIRLEQNDLQNETLLEQS